MKTTSRFQLFQATRAFFNRKTACHRAGCSGPRMIYMNFLFLFLIICHYHVFSQTSAFDPRVNCVNGCTAKDIKNITAALVFPTPPNAQLPANFFCENGENVNVKLAVFLTTNTQKAGLYVYANIRNSSTNALIGTVSECFSTGALTTVLGATKVVFSQVVTWSCGTAIKLTDVYVAWGTGTDDFCAGSPLPRCPATTSKCFAAAAGEYVPVVIPVGTNSDASKCPDVPGGTTATFNLHNLDESVLAGQTGIVTYYENQNFTGAIAPNESAYVSTSKTIWAKITNNNVSSSAIEITLTVRQSPATPALSVVNNCNGTSTITATGLVNGAAFTWSDGGSGNPRTVSATTALTITQTVNGCTSAASNSVTPAPKTTPGAPTLGKLDNCNGTSTITAASVQNGATLVWSDGGTGNPRIVSATTPLSVTQTVNGCTSASSNSVTPAPKTTPGAPTLEKLDNCNATSTITAAGVVNGATLTWSDGGTGNPRIVSATTSLTVTQTVDGCTSASSNSVTPVPKTTPGAPGLGKLDNCNGTSTITATNVVNGATLTWSDGGTGNPRIVSATTPLTVTQTVDGCTSASSNSVTPAPKTTPGAPGLGKLDNCNGTSTITATNVVNGATLNWSDGGTGNPRIVSATTALTVTQTVDGCTSASSNSVTPAPKTTPGAPGLGKLDNCDGTSTITATGVVNGATLTWSDGGTGNPRIVSATTSLTVTQTVDGCTSASSNSVTPAPKTTPGAPGLGKLDNCNGTSTITATNVVNGATLNWSDGGTGNPRIVSATTALTVTQTVNGCTSSASNSVTPAPKSTPSAPQLCVIQPSLCGPTTGTVKVLSGSAGDEYSLNDGAWQSSNEFTGLAAGSNPSIKVKNAGGCISAPTNCTSASICAPSAPAERQSAPAQQQKNSITKEPSKTIIAFNDEESTVVKAFPNPFSDKVKFVINSTVSGQGDLILYNQLGQKVRTVYSGRIVTGTQTIELNIPEKQNANYVYILSVAGKRITGKLMQLNQ